MSPFVGILLFSLIETLTVIVWLALLGVSIPVSGGGQLLAGIVLFLGYVIEHIVAFNVGKGRPFTSYPRA